MLGFDNNVNEKRKKIQTYTSLTCTLLLSTEVKAPYKVRQDKVYRKKVRQ